MITAIDTSVLVDVLGGDERFAGSSRQALTRASREGALIVSPVVVAELRVAYRDHDTVRSLLLDLVVHVVAIDVEDALSAGQMHRGYLESGGTRARVMADFLVGAHALHHADRLLARDRGFFRRYFTELEVWDPSG